VTAAGGGAEPLGERGLQVGDVLQTAERLLGQLLELVAGGAF
jgi:hypothetical protein